MKEFKLILFVLSMVFIAVSPVTADLVAHWPLDGNAKDIIGGYDGVIHGSVRVTTDRFGNPNGAMLFDGNPDDRIPNYILTPFMPSIPQGQSITISAWVKAAMPTTDLSRSSYLLGLERSGGQQLSLGFRRGEGTVGLVFRQDNGQSYGVVGETDVRSTGWRHIVAIRDANKDHFKIYIDGIPDGTVQDNSVSGVNLSNQVRLAIGAINNTTFGAKEGFYGAIDDVKYYDHPVYSNRKGLFVNRGRLYYANGSELIIRGINHGHAWHTDKTNSFKYIKNTGSNTIRVALSSGHLWPKSRANDVANVIQLCKDNGLVCVLEVHDTTGFGEKPGAISLETAVGYWKTIKGKLVGKEGYVIINIGNEPYGNINSGGWVKATKDAIGELRNAGFDHMIMVDGPNWGQDWRFIMSSYAKEIFNSDPDKNTVFSIHMYSEFTKYNDINSYLSRFIDKGLPIVIGEFAHEHKVKRNDGTVKRFDVDEDSIMERANYYNIGYLGWSWSGNEGLDKGLDLVNNFNPNNLTWWGCRLINGVNGIKGKSHTCSKTSPAIPMLLLNN